MSSSTARHATTAGLAAFGLLAIMPRSQRRRIITRSIEAVHRLTRAADFIAAEIEARSEQQAPRPTHTRSGAEIIAEVDARPASR